MSVLLGPLYHWAPAKLHKLILASGLLPRQRPTVATEPLPHLCFGVDPASAWALSGEMPWAADVWDWDLWQVTLDDRDPVTVRPEFGPQIREITVAGGIPPARIWWVASRVTVPAGPGGPPKVV